MSRALFPESAAPGGERAEAEEADRALAERIREGDAAAFETLFHRYYGRLHAFARTYVRAPEAAEDLVADVFVRVWERRTEWELRGGPRAYLYGAVRNEALAWLRRQRMLDRAHADALRDDRRPGMGAAPLAGDAQLEARELAEAIDRAVDALPDRSREAFVLHRRHGLSYAEVAAAMDISPRTVEVHIGRAFKALRTRLSTLLSLLVMLSVG
ncbi:MAG TPA: RNA polymerase sigma-70 factor [Longimicrobium sp.]|nr:RNA polymerase sigma-70 factor [Longimicrobium sp.]